MKSGVFWAALCKVAVAVSFGAGTIGPAKAEWYRADSDHFVVYADDREKDVREFGEQLEKYHQALLFLTSGQDVVPSPSNRVTIFVVGSGRKVEKLFGEGGSNVAGFYVPRAGGSRAFVPNIRLTSNDTDFSMIVLMHEYAHHLLISTSRFSMPRWYNEGAAEFFAAAKFDRDGSVWMGRPAQHRAMELAYARYPVKVAELLDHELYENRKSKDDGGFYGRSWALYHYLSFEPSRSGQLRAYTRAITEGKSETAAARAAFGDIDVLQDELDGYLRERRMMAFKLKPELLPAVRVEVTQLTEGESEVMPYRIRSQRGVDAETAAEVVKDIREVAERFPNDAGVLTALAEAEFDAGDSDAAIAAADRALAIDKTRVNAYVQKGYALFRKAADAPVADRPQAFSQALLPFQALNRIENDHPLPLMYYYQTFTAQGEEPPELARHALERASQLAPFDEGLAFQVALMQAGEGKITLARHNLGAIAANPHGGKLAEMSRQFEKALSEVEEGQTWQPSTLDTALADISSMDIDVN